VKIQSKHLTVKNPPEYFTGDVWMDGLATLQNQGQHMVVAKARFVPAGRTTWHSHALGQMLHVTEGVAWVQARGWETPRSPPGQTIYTPPGEEHWHGATPDDFTEHLAVLENADDQPPPPGLSKSVTRNTTAPDTLRPTLSHAGRRRLRRHG
jgi:quercetin dioxygenase-like cupin family protein